MSALDKLWVRQNLAVEMLANKRLQCTLDSYAHKMNSIGITLHPEKCLGVGRVHLGKLLELSF